MDDKTKEEKIEEFNSLIINFMSEEEITDMNDVYLLSELIKYAKNKL